MQLPNCPDFDRIMQRWDALWRQEILDRPIVNIGVKPKKRPVYPQKTHASLRERWFDFDHGLACMEAGVAAFEPVADNIPTWYANLGPEVCATVFGCELDFSEYSSWSRPVCSNIRDVLNITPNFDNVYWKWIRQATEESIRRANGRWITGLTDIHTTGDLLAALRDPQELCMDIADDPEGVRLACEYVTKFYPRMYDDVYEPIAKAGLPCTTWTNYFHFGKSYVSQCDFICMISPASFEETILPSIRRENEHLERTIYHLDGPGALPHLDALLERGKIDMLQWVFGAGNNPARRWLHVYKRAQAKGASLQLLCDDMADAKVLMQNLSPKGAWLCVGGQYTREEVDAFLADVTRWGQGKPM